MSLWVVPVGQLAAQAPTPMADWQLSAGVVLIPYFIKDVPRWQGAIAAGAVRLPGYEGAEHMRLLPIVAGELRYRDVAYLSSSEGLGYNLFKGRSYRIGTSLGYDIGRQERRGSQLAGLGDIDPAPELKFYAEKVLFPVVLRASARHTLDGSTGWSVDFGAYLPIAGGKQFLVLAGPAISVADSTASQRRFGVSAAQAQASRMPEYDAGGGVHNASLGFSATYFFDEAWFFNATGSVQQLLGSAADSPIVDDKTQTALILLAGYRW